MVFISEDAEELERVGVGATEEERLSEKEKELLSEEAIKILSILKKEKEISIYDLLDKCKDIKGMDLDMLLRIVYFLASRNIVSIGTIKGEDGLETSVKLTTLGEIIAKEVSE